MSSPENADPAQLLNIQANWPAVRTLAPERFDAYRKPGDQDELDAIARYAWNIDVSKALHPKLHILEVSFRNQLHNALTALYGSAWYDRPRLLRAGEAAKIAKAKDELTQKRRPHDPGRIVAALSFGFWTSLYGHRYETTIGRQTPRMVFPLFPGTPARAIAAMRLREMRFLRKRISHFEHVAFDPHLPRLHQEAGSLIGWMHPQMAELSDVGDDFLAVYGRTWKAYRPVIEMLFS